MRIRKYIESDCLTLLELFFNTVRSVNIKEYSQEQVEAWAPDNYIQAKYERWSKTLKENFTLVAEIDDKIVGFADISNNGYLDRLFIHKDYQRMGIASTLLREIFSYAKSQNIKEITTEASITAKPFFEKFGFAIVQKQQVKINGVFLTNFLMKL